MRKIVSIDRPFDMVKSFIVYEDGNKIDVQEYTVEDRTDKLFALVKKYNIKQVDLVGPKKYMAGVKNQIEKAKITLYELNQEELDVEINII